MKTASYLAEVVTDPAMAASDEPDNVAFSIAMRTDKDWWTWAESPENSMYLQRFSLAMSAAKQVMPEQTTVEGTLSRSGWVEPEKLHAYPSLAGRL